MMSKLIMILPLLPSRPAVYNATAAEVATLAMHACWLDEQGCIILSIIIYCAVTLLDAYIRLGMGSRTRTWLSFVSEGREPPPFVETLKKIFNLCLWQYILVSEGREPPPFVETWFVAHVQGATVSLQSFPNKLQFPYYMCQSFISAVV